MARIDSFLRLVAEQQASDLHFHSGNVPIIRHDGHLVPLPFRVLSERETRRFIWEILDDEQREELEREQGLDFVHALEGFGRFRTNVFVQSSGISAVFRVVPNRLPTLDELQFPASIKKLTRLSNGLVLITGPTNSGKTTTLAALVHEINKSSQRHIISIEDPIEFVHKPIESLVTQRQVGQHTASFGDALRSALRESPDVLVIGELRDLDTVSLALAAAETGVLVFGTLHTNTAAKAVSRILDIMPEKSLEQTRSTLSLLLRGVVAQQLCRRANGDGRVAALEVLLQSYGLSNMIRENKIHQIEGYLQSMNFAETGMMSMDSCLFDFIKDGVVVLEEAAKAANHSVSLRQRVAKELTAEEEE